MHNYILICCHRGDKMNNFVLIVRANNEDHAKNEAEIIMKDGFEILSIMTE